MPADSRSLGEGRAPEKGLGYGMPAGAPGTAKDAIRTGTRAAASSRGASGPIGREPFGLRAVRMGFVSWDQVEKALAVQKKLRERGIHRLIGMIMIELEMLDTTQLLSVLKSYELERETGSAAPETVGGPGGAEDGKK